MSPFVNLSIVWLEIAACIIQSALFAGLNLAVFSLSLMRLQIAADRGNADAARVLDLRKDAKPDLGHDRSFRRARSAAQTENRLRPIEGHRVLSDAAHLPAVDPPNGQEGDEP